MAELTADVPSWDEYFGDSVSILGTLVLIGVAREDTGVVNYDEGVAYLFGPDGDASTGTPWIRKSTRGISYFPTSTWTCC